MTHTKLTRQEYRNLLERCSLDGTFPSRHRLNCYYRLDGTPESKQRCAIGVLIPDDKYHTDMEAGLTVTVLTHPFIQDYFPEGVSIDLMNRIQRLHDRTTPWCHSRFIQGVDELLGTCPWESPEEAEHAEKGDPGA